MVHLRQRAFNSRVNGKSFCFAWEENKNVKVYTGNKEVKENILVITDP